MIVVRTWNSLAEARKAAETAAIIFQETGTLPSDYVNSIKATLKVSRKGEIQEFYEALSVAAPKALKFFMDLKLE